MPTPRGPAGAGTVWLAALALGVWLLAAGAAMAAPADHPVLLGGGADLLHADGLASTWLDDSGSATVEDVAGHPGRLQPAPAGGGLYPLAPGKALWLRLRLARAEGSRDQWLLAHTNPLVDQVDVWQQDERGRWRVQSAGDRIAVDRWPERSRYPVFRLELPAGQARDVFVRVRGTVAASVPLQLRTAAAHAQRLQAESLGLGAALGAMLLLVSACLAQSLVYRDRAYAWYAVFTAITTLNLLAYSGMAAQLLWPGSAAWADAAPGALAFPSAGASMLFVRQLTGIAARSSSLDRLVSIAGWAGLPLGAVYVLAPRPIAMQLLSVFLGGAVLLDMAAAWLSWRRRDVVGLWVLLACAPLTVGVLLAILCWLGRLPLSLGTQYGFVVAVVVQVPLLLAALSIRSRDRHSAQVREQAMASQDALTGLLAPQLFHDRLRQVVARFRRDRDDAAVVLIDLVNHGRIRAAYGSAVAEQSLVRSVIKLRRVVRDVDTIGRIGEARFGLILEGVTSRTAVTQRAARLIAAGLMPLQGLKPEVTLHFHVAGVLLRERQVDADELPHLLGELLASMSPRTRRPIRFLLPEETQPVSLDPDSEPPADPVPAR